MKKWNTPKYKTSNRQSKNSRNLNWLGLPTECESVVSVNKKELGPIELVSSSVPTLASVGLGEYNFDC